MCLTKKIPFSSGARNSKNEYSVVKTADLKIKTDSLLHVWLHDSGVLNTFT